MAYRKRDLDDLDGDLDDCSQDYDYPGLDGSD
jgi:hypothetical protein